MITLIESSTLYKTHIWMLWVTTRTCERSCLNSFTNLSSIWTWTRSTLARDKISKWLMTSHCRLGVSRTHISSSWDFAKPWNAIMSVKTYADGLITFSATSSSVLTLREASIRIQVSPMRTVSIWRRLVRVILIWQSHISYKCTTTDKLQRMWSSSKWKSIQPKNTKKRFSNTIL